MPFFEVFIPNEILHKALREKKFIDQSGSSHPAIFDRRAIDEFEAAKLLDAAAEVLHKSLDQLVDKEKQISEKAKSAVSRAKDSANQLADQLQRVHRLLGPDFEIRLQQLERMAESLQKLEGLAKSGSLQSVISALSK